MNQLFDRKIKYNQTKTKMMGEYTIKLQEEAFQVCSSITDHILYNLLDLVSSYETVTTVLTTLGNIFRYKVGFLNSMKYTKEKINKIY